MSYCPKNLRLNRFKRVYLPSNKEMYMRYGFRPCGDGYSSSGERTDAIQLNLSKLDQIRLGEYEVMNGYQQSIKESQIPLAETQEFPADDSPQES